MKFLFEIIDEHDTIKKYFVTAKNKYIAKKIVLDNNPNSRFSNVYCSTDDINWTLILPETNEEKLERLLTIFKEETESKSGQCRALYVLLEMYKNVLPEIDDYFQKTFRQTDVTDSGQLDMVFWHLMNGNTLFWSIFDSVVEEVEVDDSL